MYDLKLSTNEIKNLISLREEYWEHQFGTNCLAFALGLDINENDIFKKAYKLGVMGSIIKGIPIKELNKLSFEERLFLDLDAIGIKHTIVASSEKSGFWIDHNYIYTYWLISLFSNGDDFHFMRKSYDGTWYHKFGYFAPVINYDFDKKIITEPECANLGDYKNVKTYRLQYKKII